MPTAYANGMQADHNGRPVTATGPQVSLTGPSTDYLLASLLSIGHRFEAQRQDENALDQRKSEWFLVALVIDRLMLMLYTFLVGITSLAILLNRKYEYDDGLPPLT